MTFFRVYRARRWRVVVRAYDLRECPYCLALVFGNAGQRGHADWHEDIDQGTEPAEPAELADVDEMEMAE